MASLKSQELLDADDEELAFVLKKENVKPITMFRHDNIFLLCYDDFGFFVDRSGRRARPDILIYWEGNPNAFGKFLNCDGII